MISDATLLAYHRAPTGETATLRRLEKAAIAKIEKDTGRYFGPEAEIIEVVRWRGWPLALANEPIDGAITLIEEWNGTSWVTSTFPYYVFGSFIFGSFIGSQYQQYRCRTPLFGPQQYRVTYDAGYEQDTDDNVWAAPEDIQQAVLLLVGHWYENREAVVVGDSSSGELPLSYWALIDSHARASVG